ncbi:hypothetical protein BC332_07667 [Capsicum chinense]|nr:hypothetical protein BC332_07667 [Capsicum chinense]
MTRKAPKQTGAHQKKLDILAPTCAVNELRVINRLRRVSDGILIRDAVSPRAFMSSSIITEAFQENSKSKAYGSEQIQVKKIYCHYLSYMTFWSNIRLGERKEPSILQETIISFGVLGSVGPFVKPEKVMPFK